MASNIEVASYDPKKVNLVMNGKIITGFASDSMITIARNEDTVTTQVGVKGDVGYSENKVGRPIKITSGYRCIVHNASKTVGGSPNSKHRYGMAADWRLKDRGLNPVALGILAVEAGFGGVGIYWYGNYAFVHADTRNAKATWLCDATKHYPSTTYLKFILPTIRRGCTGDANRAATKMLQRLLGLTPDGIFGEKTENALLKAQEKHKLAVDGICGPASWKAISGASKYL